METTNRNVQELLNHLNEFKFLRASDYRKLKNLNAYEWEEAERSAMEKGYIRKSDSKIDTYFLTAKGEWKNLQK